jgi:hypothetical protein
VRAARRGGDLAGPREAALAGVQRAVLGSAAAAGTDLGDRHGGAGLWAGRGSALRRGLAGPLGPAAESLGLVSCMCASNGSNATPSKRFLGSGPVPLGRVKSWTNVRRASGRARSVAADARA